MSIKCFPNDPIFGASSMWPVEKKKHEKIPAIKQVSLLEGQVGYSGVFCIYGARLGKVQKGSPPPKKKKTTRWGPYDRYKWSYVKPPKKWPNING